MIADFSSAIDSHPLRKTPPYDEHPDTIPNIFRNLNLISDSVESVKKIIHSEKFEVYFASTAPWNNPSAWTDKRLWLEDQFGDSIIRKLIITHRKDLLKGDILIDDRPNNGAKNFEGRWIQFGTQEYPDWNSILRFLFSNEI